MSGTLKYDLTNQLFGCWKAIKYEGKGNWTCECRECGYTRTIGGYFLMNGPIPLCDHQKPKKESWVGRKFGNWEVIEDEGHRKVTCSCTCGVIREVSRADLKYGKSTGCGHGTQRHSKENLLGLTAGDWEVIGYDDEAWRWVCKCKCGHISKMATGEVLKSANYKCKHSKQSRVLQDLTGKDFDFWHVVCRADPPQSGGSSMWRCRCKCGKESEVSGYALRMGLSRSCGCQANQLRQETCTERYGVRAVPQIDTARTQAQLANDIAQMFPGAIQSDRKTLEGTEIDLYYPDRRIGIEFNGCYLHSELKKSPRYHQDKTLRAHRYGLRLIHVFEYEWFAESRREKVLGIVARALGTSDIRHEQARQCQVREISQSEAAQFLNKYHLQNSAKSSVRYGIYKGPELLGAMTFGKPRFNSTAGWELIRLAWKTGVSVVGGAERMFSHFVGKYEPDSVITYCDIAKFSGNIYTKLGFKLEQLTRPNYVWVNVLTHEVKPRYQTTKAKLLAQGLGSEVESETDIMERLGYSKIYDSGNLRLRWSRENNMVV